MSIVRDIFDPSHYANVSLPLEDCEALPTWCFTSEEFYRREVERIFMRVWNFVGRADEVPNPGDYFAFDVAGEPIIVIRDRERRVRSFANTCRHRGARLLSGTGTVRTIACPYHGWTYGIGGELAGAPGMQDTRGFDRARYGLMPIRIEEWDGFLFVNFDPNAIPLMEYLGDLPRLFAPYNFKDIRCTRRIEYDLECNWKIYAENSTECYHTPYVHGGSIGKQVANFVPSLGSWSAIHMPMADTCAVLPEDKTTFPQIATLAGLPKTGTFFCLIYPGATFCCTQDCMWWLSTRPVSATRSKLSVGSCFPASTVARADFEEVARKYYHRWDVSTPEDNAITAVQQAGLAASRRPAGRMSVEEPVVHQLAVWVKDRVIGNLGPA